MWWRLRPQSSRAPSSDKALRPGGGVITRERCAREVLGRLLVASVWSPLWYPRWGAKRSYEAAVQKADSL